jgi:hypothetical protein
VNVLNIVGIAVKALSQRAKIDQIIREATPIIDKATPIVHEVLQKWPKLGPLVQDVFGGLFGTPSHTTPPTTPTASEFDVKWLQTSLNTLGFGPIAVDGDMGPQTHEAIKKFQAAHGLTVDGWAGMDTIPAIYAELSKKK